MRIDGFNFAVNNDPANPVLNNSGVLIRSLRFLPPSTVVIRVENKNSTPRYFYALNLESSFMRWSQEKPLFGAGATANYNFVNLDSVDNFGEQSLDSTVKVYPFDGFSVALNTFWQAVVDRFGENQKKYEIEINNRKDLKFTENTAFFDKKNLLTQGNIIAKNDNQADKQSLTLLASAIRPEIATVGDYLTQENGFLFALEDGSGFISLE